MKRERLSPNFYLDEFVRSETAVRHGIDMSVPVGGIVYSNLRRLCRMVLQPVRAHFGPVHITSGYRPDPLNKLIGGSPTSEHRSGRAADFIVPGATPLEVARWIRDHLTTYEQLIHEFGEWVHVSTPPGAATAGQETLTALKQPRTFRKPRTVYVRGLHTVEAARTHLV